MNLRTERFLYVLIISTLVNTGIGFAVEPQGKSQRERLLQAIKKTQVEIQEEQKWLEERKGNFESRLREAEQKLQKLSDEYVEKKISFSKKNVKLQRLREQQDIKQQKMLETENEINQVSAIFANAARQLEKHINSLPPSEDIELHKNLLQENRLFQKDQIPLAQGANAVIRLAASTLKNSRSSALYQIPTRDHEGYLTQADCLRVGEIFYARELPGQSGISIAAPQAKDEIMWSEYSGNDDGLDLSSLLDGTFKNNFCTLPLDVTCNMPATEKSDDDLWSGILAGGPVMVPLLAIPVIALILAIERVIYFLRQTLNTIAVGDEIINACRKDCIQEASEIARKKNQVISRVLLACIENRDGKTEDMEDAVQESLLHELPALERFEATLRMLAAIAPLLGLLGTVTGMIGTFRQITLYGTGDPGIMAGGISEALITTASGLTIAIPLLLMHNAFKGRTQNVLGDVERYAATLLNLFKTDELQSSRR